MNKYCPPYIQDYHKTYFRVKGTYVKVKTPKTDRKKLNWYRGMAIYLKSDKHKELQRRYKESFYRFNEMFA